MDKEKNENSYHKINLNWFPGHMAKTLKQIEEDLKLVDLVIELLDARIPISSQNPVIKKIIANKKRIIILNKADLADSIENENWVNKFENQNVPCILCNSNSGEGIGKITRRIESIMEEEKQKAEAKGRIGKIIRVMIIGIPNVGKSSLINRLSQKTSAKVGNKPGVTKQKQWIRLSNNIELLDTPGVLWPRLDNNIVALNLAYTGTIKNEILDEQDIAYNLLKYLIKEYRKNVVGRYSLKEDIVEAILKNEELEENEQIVEIMNYIGEKRGAITKGNSIDLEKVSRIIVDDFRSGNLGKITLEKAN